MGDVLAACMEARLLGDAGVAATGDVGGMGIEEKLRRLVSEVCVCPYAPYNVYALYGIQEIQLQLKGLVFRKLRLCLKDSEKVLFQLCF
jgi:hypothetical protein